MNITKMRYYARFLPHFWGSRLIAERITFIFSQQQFAARQQVLEKVSSINSAGALVKVCLPRLLILIASIPLVLWLEQLIKASISWAHLDPTWALSGDGPVSLLSALAQLNGALAGLYFATIGIVFSTTYLKVSDELRGLFLQHPILRIYILALVQLAGISVILCLLSACGMNVGFLPIALIAFSSALVVIGTVPVAYTTFNLINPLYLIPLLNKELFRWVGLASHKGFKTTDRTFQSYYQQRAGTSLMTLSQLAHSMIDRQPESLNQLAVDILHIYNSYAQEKSKIPTDSYWFKRIYKNQSWSEAEFTQIRHSLQLGTRLVPNIVADELWVEKSLANSLTTIIASRLGKETLTDAFALGESVGATLEQLSTTMRIDESLYLEERCRTVVHSWLDQQSSNTIITTDANTVDAAVSVVDAYWAGYNCILLGFYKWCCVQNLNSLIDSIIEQAAHKSDKLSLPRFLMREIEYVQSGIEFEISVEGKRITPDWYLRETFACVLSNAIATNLETLITTLGAISRQTIGHSAALSPLEMQLCERSIEGCTKLTIWLAQIEECWLALRKNRRLDDLIWKDIDWNSHKRTLVKLRQASMLHLSALAFRHPPSTNPHVHDFAGHAYWRLLNECHTAILQGDTEFIKDALPQILFKASRDYRESQNKTESLECLIDAVELSSYSKIYTELGMANSWSTVSAVWNDHLNKPVSVSIDLTNLLATLTQFDHLPNQGPHSHMRSLWKVTMERELHTQGLLPSLFGSGDMPIEHQSVMIKALLPALHDMNLPIEVFVASLAREVSSASSLRDGRDLGTFFTDWNELETELERDQGNSEADSD